MTKYFSFKVYLFSMYLSIYDILKGVCGVLEICFARYSFIFLSMFVMSFWEEILYSCILVFLLLSNGLSLITQIPLQC